MPNFKLEKLTNKECRELLKVIHARVVAYNTMIDDVATKCSFNNPRMVIEQAYFDLNKTIKLDFENYSNRVDGR